MKKSIVASLLTATTLFGAPLAVQAADIAIALHVDPTHLMFDVGRKMKDLLEERSNGEFSVTLLGTEVGGERDQLEGASFGEYQITLGGSMPMTLYAPDYAASDLPFVYSSTEEARAVYEGSLGEAIDAAFVQNGQLHLVGLSKRNPRNLTANQEITTPDGVDGLRLRVPEIAPWVKIWSGIGASPSPIAWPEVYTSLQTGVIEAQENPVNFIHAGKLYEVQDYLMKTEHVYSFFHWLMSDQFYQSLSDEDREMIQGVIDEAIAWGDEQTDALQGKLYAELEANGMTVVEVDKDAFRTAATPAIIAVAASFAPEVQNYVLSFIDGE